MRWWTLMALSISLLIVIIDSTVVNVALPTLQRELGASASELQWIVDAYILVFAALVLTTGSLSDRWGRKRALLTGMVVFGLASLMAAFAQNAGQLIAARAAMGVGGALISPSTLSVIIDVFPKEERGKAIGIWTAVASVGVPIGPVLGGWLLEQFWWGAVFLINIPIVLLMLVAGAFLVPESRDPAPAKVDIPGAILSAAALSSLIYAIIEAPAAGWLDPVVLAAFAIALVLGGVFIVYEHSTDHPMLDVRIFKNADFSSGAGANALAFLAMVGTTFILTQYLQFVREYTPFEAGLRVIPMPIGFMVAGVLSSRLVARLGARWTIAGGLTIVSATLVTLSFLDIQTQYWIIGLALAALGLGMGSTMAPATETVMSSVPNSKAGVGSAVNTVSRQVGAALGVGVLGSLLNWTYSTNIADAVAGLPAADARLAQNSVGVATQIATNLGGPTGDTLRAATYSAFVDGFGLAMLFGATAVFIGALLVLRFMPCRGLIIEEQPVSRLGRMLSLARCH